MDAADFIDIGTDDLSEDDKAFLEKKKYPACVNWVHTNPCRILVPRNFKDMSEKLRQFEFRPQDVVMMSYPKSGTTWLSEILWAMTSVHELHRAEEEAIMDRIIFLHNDILRPVKEDDDTVVARKFRSKFPGKDVKDGVVLNLAKVAPDRRVVRTHILPPLLHPNLLKTTKLVYLLRNPKDTCVSYYHYRKDSSLAPFLGDFSDFCELFMGNVMPWGVYWNHVRQMWALRGHPNVHFIFYEDLQKNLMGELEKLNQFFTFGLSEDQLKRNQLADAKKLRSFPATYKIDVASSDLAEGDHAFLALKKVAHVQTTRIFCLSGQKGHDLSMPGLAKVTPLLSVNVLDSSATLKVRGVDQSGPRVAEHADIKSMRRREAKIPFLTSIKHTFFREGKVGGWASLTTPELDTKMDKWIEDGSQGLDIKFTYQ